MPIRGNFPHQSGVDNESCEDPRRLHILSLMVADLKFSVLGKQLGPYNSVNTLRLRDIRREDPEPSLFKIPKDHGEEGDQERIQTQRTVAIRP